MIIELIPKTSSRWCISSINVGFGIKSHEKRKERRIRKRKEEKERRMRKKRKREERE